MHLGILKKRIVHAIFSMTNGGAENMIVDIINEQIKTMHVHLIVMNTNYLSQILQKIDPAVKIHKLNRGIGSKNPYYVLKLNFLLLKIRPDIIHCHNNVFSRLLLFHRAKIILTVHDVKEPLDNLYNYKKIVAISDTVNSDIKNRSNLTLKAETVCNAINFEEITKREKYITLNNFKLVQISRLIHQKKGQDVLINAMDILINNFQLKNIFLDIIGIGPSKDYLIELIKSYRLQNNIFIIEGKTRDWIYPRLKDYELLIQPSRYEGFGLTIVEGVAAKIPVIASAIEGPKEILCNGKYGELFAVNDAADLANKILLIIKEYKTGLIQDRVEKAYAYCNSNFSMPVMIAGYNSIYEALIK